MGATARYGQRSTASYGVLRLPLINHHDETLRGATYHQDSGLTSTAQ